MSVEPPVSLIAETNKGGIEVTVCSCGVWLLHGMAQIHIDQCAVAQTALAVTSALEYLQ